MTNLSMEKKDLQTELDRECKYRREAEIKLAEIEIKLAEMVLTLKRRRMRLEEYIDELKKKNEEIIRLKAKNRYWRNAGGE